MREEDKTKPLSELVEEKEKETAGWRWLGYVGAALVLLIVAVGIAGLWRHALESRITKIENVEDPCVADLHGERCQDRTCIRLRDVGYVLSPECQARLGVSKARIQEGGAAGHSTPLQSATSDGGGGVPETKTATPRQPSEPPRAPGVGSPGDSGNGSENSGDGQSGEPPPNRPAPLLPSVCVDNPLLPICLNTRARREHEEK